MNVDRSKLGATANHPDCFRAFIGTRLRWYFAKGCDTYLIFEDGRALVIHHKTGAYWVATANDVNRELAFEVARLSAETAALANVLTLAGVDPLSPSVGGIAGA